MMFTGQNFIHNNFWWCWWQLLKYPSLSTWLFSAAFFTSIPTLNVRVSFQIACVCRWIVALIAFNLVFLHCAFFDISSNYLHNGMYNYISPTFPHCVFLNEFSQWLQLIGFTPPCVFKCFIKITWLENAKSHWLHFFSFVSSWVFK